MTSKRTLTLSILFLAAACSSSGGGDTPGGPGTGTGPATVAAYCDAYWGAYAARWAACQHASTAEAAAVYAPAPRCADMVQAVAAGRATYVAASAGACLSFVESASCDVLEAFAAGGYPHADCAAAISGRLTDGQQCFSHESCASGVCFFSPGTCPSICVTPAPAGTPCQVGAPCAAGSVCNVYLATPTCVPLSALDGSCQSDAGCGPGLFCESISLYQGACRARHTSGSCTRDEQCAIGYRCSSGSTCVAWLGAGESCTQGDNACGPGLWCGSGGTCVDGSQPHESCGLVNLERRPCIGGFCSSGFCAEWLAPGGACVQQSQCRPTDVCDLANTRLCETPCAEP